jgi:enoyl-CoA hydratase/carnithine racemase
VAAPGGDEDDVSGPFTVTIAGGVADITIDHPPSNVFDGPFTVALGRVLDGCEGDEDVRVLLFHSADPDYFCMHGDVRAIMGMEVVPGAQVTAPNAAAVLLQRVHDSRLVSIAAIDGAARGGGAELVSALDLRIGGPRTVLGQPEVAMGILPGAGGTVRLPHLLGRSRALDIILSCRDVGADEALAIGWLDYRVPSDQVLAEARRMARRIAAMPAASTAAVKAVVGATLGEASSALVAESGALAGLIGEGGHREPMARFLAAGGQSRDGERGGFERLIAAMLDDGPIG